MHTTGTREEWLAARIDLLAAEKEHTRRGDELARRRRELPWVRVEKEYLLDGPDGPVPLAGLFEGRSQLLIWHFMFAPEWDAGCTTCSSVADGFDGIRVHLVNHDVSLAAVSRAPVARLLAYRERMGWGFPWYSAGDSGFTFDFDTSFTAESVRDRAVYNYREVEGIDPRMLPVEGHGLSAFVLDGGVVYHTYSAYARGTDALWSMWQWLDRAPLGRNEGDMSWFRRHDEY